MANIFSKFTAVSLLFALMLCMCTPAFCVESDIDELLMERGFPEIVLETMQVESKNAIYDAGDEFAGAVITYYCEDTHEFIDIHVAEDGTYIIPRGQIPMADLALSFTYTKKRASNQSLDYIRVTFSYEWENLPFNRYSDPIAVAWDSDLFYLVDNSFSKVDKYDGYIIFNGEPVYSYNQIHSSEDGYARSGEGFVTWYADLKGYLGIIPSRLYGSGSFTLKPISQTYGGSMQMFGHYVHNKTVFTLSLNIDVYGSISVSGGSDFDERGTQITISW